MTQFTNGIQEILMRYRLYWWGLLVDSWSKISANYLMFFLVYFERFYSIGKISVDLFIALGLFSISRNHEPTVKNIRSNLWKKLEVLVNSRNNFEKNLSQEKNDIKENIKNNPTIRVAYEYKNEICWYRIFDTRILIFWPIYLTI